MAFLRELIKGCTYIEFVRLHNKDEKYFNESWELYNRNFPKEGNRDLNQQIKLFKEKQYRQFVKYLVKKVYPKIKSNKS